MDPTAEAKGLLAAQVVRQFGQVRLKVMGASMLPALRPGDEIIVESQPMHRMRPGEIVQFRRNGLLITHRVVAVHRDHLVTQGDAVPHPDPPLHEHEILGRVATVTRKGRCVDVSLTPSRRLAAWLLRRSEFSVRVFLKLGSRTS